jgi:hypothetical protein
MTLSDYLFDSVLVLLVLRQIRESRFDRKAMLLPLGIVGWVAHTYLHALPSGGNNLLLVAGLTLVGVLSGVVSGLNTRMRSDGGKYALVKAGWIAAGVWVLSMSGRFAFAVWASHGGGPSLYRFSVDHDLSSSVWTDALVLMALGEVVTRTGIMYLRSRKVLAAAVPAPAPQLLTV